jgi:hypothetical protein
MTDPRKCPFCEPPGDRIAFEEALAFGLPSGFDRPRERTRDGRQGC